MSQKYTFEPLELRPFDRMDISGKNIEGFESSQPHEIAAFGDEKGSRSTFTTTAYDLTSFASTHDSSDRRLSAQHASLRTSFLQRKSRRFATLWVIAALAVFASIFSAWYTYRVMVDENALPPTLQLQPGVTVLVVNILSHVAAYLCWSLFTDTMEALRWALACRPEGILLTSFLVLSQATPFVGVAYLCMTKGPHQLWAIQRYGEILSILPSLYKQPHERGVRILWLDLWHCEKFPSYLISIDPLQPTIHIWKCVIGYAQSSIATIEHFNYISRNLS
jgi:hypothetical protein